MKAPVRYLAIGVLGGLTIGLGAASVISGSSGGDAAQTASAERGGGRGGYAPTVAMAEAEDAAIEKKIAVMGEARALRSVTLTSEVTGLVDEVDLAPGKRVKKGDVLLSVEKDEQEIALARARAQYPIAKANAERFRKLAEENAASAQEAEQAFNAYKTLEADLRAAEFALTQRTVKAPFDGIAGLTTIEPGDYIRAGDVITTLDDTSSVVIEFSVPQESAGYVDIGQPVTARLASGSGPTFDGAITAIDSRVDPASRTLRVEATVPNPAQRLIPGAVFAVSTSRDGEPAIAVPGLAIQWDRAGAYVWKRDDEGAAVRAPITILQRTNDIVLVDGDLTPGDAIVSEGADRVRAGVPLPALEPRNEDAAATAAGPRGGVGPALGNAE